MAVRYVDGEVHLLWARPDSGYDVVVVEEGPDRVYVRFSSERPSRVSRVYAYYQDGKPAEEVVERGGKDDGGPGPKSSDGVRQSSSDDADRERGGD